jgi:hypothetical protein
MSLKTVAVVARAIGIDTEDHGAFDRFGRQWGDCFARKDLSMPDRSTARSSRATFEPKSK